MTKTLDLIGSFSRWEISMQYVQSMMKNLGAGPIVVKCTSLGGDLIHALKIKELFETHGDVTVEYIGFNASAATIVGHGAVKTRIREDAFYLIHKPSVWVDTWGNMNEDDLDQTIKDLQAQKKDAEVFTLSLAQDYVKSRGVDFKTVMDLMKESRWLSAQEAVDLKLVDEIIPVKSKEKTTISNEAVARMMALELPLPITSENVTVTSEMVSQLPENEKKNIFTMLANIFTPKNKLEMNKDLLKINALLGVEGFEEKDGNVTLSLEQITKIDNQLKTVAENAAKVIEPVTKVVENTTPPVATPDNSELIGLLDALDPTVASAVDAKAKIEAIRAKLAERPTVAAVQPQGSSSKPVTVKDETDWNTINNLPHNQIADNEII